MPWVEHKAFVKAPLKSVWDFICVMNNWAKYLKGYQKHEELNEKESVWTLKGDVGVLCRVVHFKVFITEWSEPEKVKFILEGINERLTGEGRFLALPIPDNNTELNFKLTLNAGGMIGPLVNVMLKPMLKPVTVEMAENISKEIERLQA
ncbi:MAG: SRPBCC family protein [Proteobacteria bacterium]|nr:SRPBCC family protein [Pseudomonadota bacterium]